jgi:hypothetical protein
MMFISTRVTPASKEDAVVARASIPALDLECVQHNGKPMIKVPWDVADLLHERLRALGVGSTLHLVPAGREAYLDPWNSLGIEQVRSLLAA